MRHGVWKVLAKLNGGELGRFSNINTDNAHEAQSAKLTDIEIYRLSDDIAETNNRAGENPKALARLTAALESAYRDLLGDSLVWVKA